MRKFRLSMVACAAVVAVIATLAMPTSANAGFTIVLSESGFATTTYTVPTISFVGGQYSLGPITYGDYSIQISGKDSAPGINPALGGAAITQNTLSVSAPVGAANALTVQVYDNTFNNLTPNGFGVLSNALSSTDIEQGSVSAIGGVNSFSNVTPTLTATAPVGPGNPYAKGNTALVAMGGASTYLLGNQAIISGLTTAGMADNFTITTVLVATPEPASMLAVLTGLPVLGFAWYRRRNAVKVA